MEYRNRIVSVVAFTLAAALLATPAWANRTFVSPTGNDANPCSLQAPCRNFQAALAQTTSGGEIVVLGSAGYNGGAIVNINKSVSIVNPGGYQASIAVPSGSVGVLIIGAPNDVVSLRGLTIDGAGVGSVGIQYISGKSLTIENSVVRQNTGYGIWFCPNTASSLLVSNSVVSDNAINGIYVVPSGSNTVSAIFNRVQANNNTAAGIILDGNNSTGTVRGTVADSVASGNVSVGLWASTQPGKAATTLSVIRSVAANNGYGLFSNGAILRVGESMVTGNTGGWGASNGGSVQSYGNNAINGNGGDESAPASVALK